MARLLCSAAPYYHYRKVCFDFGCADLIVWRYQSWVGFFVEGFALHTSRRTVSKCSLHTSRKAVTPM